MVSSDFELFLLVAMRKIYSVYLKVNTYGTIVSKS